MRIGFAAAEAGDEAQAELRSLHRWLAKDQALRDGVRLEAVVDEDAGVMGPSVEVVLAVISSAVALAEFPLSFTAWRHAKRPQRPPVVVVLDGGDPDRRAELLRELGVEAMPGAGPGDESPDGHAPDGDGSEGDGPATGRPDGDDRAAGGR
ncbi:hypothetical protein [Streptomyces sp. NPDC058373]|uniref:effector-associated constant component EACC1 n=1 Tax=Streptomyces sp. NPDC058373 TaxID=3346465 RepID=UPI003668D63A